MSRRFLAALFALVVFAACSRDAVPPPAANTPVFLISIDTLRSDHLPVYGYKGVETPNIDALRGEGILYERAYSHCPLTLPSHSSMLTGVLPAEHGNRDNIGYVLSPNVKSIAEILKANGYATGAAVSAFVLRRESGLNRGFDLYDDAVEPITSARTIGNIQRDGGVTEQIAAQWLAQQQKPVFFFLHLYEPHTPYTPPEPYLSRYPKHYDGEIARVDAIVGTFVQSLKDAGLYDKALIILTSDHGEGLGDHGEEEHGIFLYREALQVPLIVKLPEQKLAGATVSSPVQTIDIVPTILERTAITAPSKLPGRSLISFAGEKTAQARNIYSETYYPRLHFGWADQHSLIDGTHHYLQSPKAELFDLVKDPAEKNNVIADDRRALFAMRNAIAPFIREAEAPGKVDSEEAAKLAALGYLGSTVQTKPGEVLPDPKDNLDAMHGIGQAFTKYRDKQYDAALALTNELLKTNPRILDLWDVKSKILTKLGRPDEAIEAAKEGLRLSPHATHLAIEIARLQLEQQQLDDAQRHAELALKSDPGQANEVLARIWLERKNFAKAEEAAQAAIASDRERVAPLVTLARVKRDAGKLDEALALLDRAVSVKREKEEVAMLFFIRGDVLARMGRAEEAERD
ncbi:MAG TPA: sulfatase-like hydrolase/transferase, partial [Thermoanaerobaculia bacterium]|nr:sulfatase-like hydrolase/transferase [Thermoanaerobaculia bacterium]